MKTNPILAALVLCTWSTLPVAGDDKPATGRLKVESLHDVTYIKRGDAELKLDLAGPAESAGPFPAVLVIHGGAWTSGSKDSNRKLLRRVRGTRLCRRLSAISLLPQG